MQFAQDLQTADAGQTQVEQHEGRLGIDDVVVGRATREKIQRTFPVTQSKDVHARIDTLDASFNQHRVRIVIFNKHDLHHSLARSSVKRS